MYDRQRDRRIHINHNLGVSRGILGVSLLKEGTMYSNKLKADRLHPRDYPHMPTEYRHTDKHLRLVMTLNAHCCTRQRRAPKTNGWMDGRMLPSTLFSRFAVDNDLKCINADNGFPRKSAYPLHYNHVKGAFPIGCWYRLS